MYFNTEQELLDYTRNIIGKTFKSLDLYNLLSNKKDKGLLGKIVETGFYKYPLNNNPACDFANLGIELKVTGFKRNKNKTLSAKERVSLSSINFDTIIHEDYEFSKLIFKNRKILFIWYEYDTAYKDNWGEFKIFHYQLYNMSIDNDIFKNDFNLIKQKVLDGQAHELSEGDTSYLGAAPKGKNGQDVVSQPNSSILAMKRAYSLKNSYMTGILRSLNNSSTLPVKTKLIEDYLLDLLSPYIGMTQLEIWKKLTGIDLIEPIPKNLSKMISDKLIGKDTELPLKDDLFNKTTYIIKNTSLDSNLYPLERISFRNLTLSEFNEPWESSDWKSYYEEVTILLICYEGSRQIKNGFRRLKSVKKIAFTNADLEKFALSYTAIRETIRLRDISYLPIPQSFSNQILEIAPKGTKGANAYNTFFEKDTTKTCFMLQKDFVATKIKTYDSSHLIKSFI